MFGEIQLQMNCFEGNFSNAVGFKCNLDKNRQRQEGGAANTVKAAPSFHVRNLHLIVPIMKF